MQYDAAGMRRVLVEPEAGRFTDLSHDAMCQHNFYKVTDACAMTVTCGTKCKGRLHGKKRTPYVVVSCGMVLDFVMNRGVVVFPDSHRPTCQIGTRSFPKGLIPVTIQFLHAARAHSEKAVVNEKATRQGHLSRSDEGAHPDTYRRNGESTRRSHNEWQFGLRGLLCAVTVFGVVLALASEFGVWIIPLAGAGSVLVCYKMRRGLLASWIVCGISFCVPTYLFFDVLSLGPYTRWYNHDLWRRAHVENLIGRPANEVVPILGRATDVWNMGGDAVTYNYHPLPGIPCRKFQVHCHGGIVTGVEMFDD